MFFYQHLFAVRSPFCAYAYMCVLVCVQILYYFIVDMYVHCMCAFFPVSLTYPKAVPTAAGASIYDSERHSFNINTYKNT